MLRRLNIRNHALIEEADLSFKEGFHVFTGETGSGKSILLGAVGLLLGDRADSNGVGLNGDRAVIEGEFFAPELSPWLKDQDMPEAMGISIRREVLRNGRSRVFVNDAQATVGQLKELGGRLVNLHKQDDVDIAFDRRTLSDILDVAGNHGAVKDAYLSAHSAWLSAKAELEALEALARAPSGDAHYLEHQIHELDALRLHTLDWDSLLAELRTLQHAHELHEGISHAASACDGNEGGAMLQIEEARRALANLGGLDREVDEIVERFMSLRIELQDIADTLWQLQERKQPDPNRLTQLESVHDAVVRAMRKHQVDTPQELMAKRDVLNRQFEAIEGLEEALAAARALHDQMQRALTTAGTALTEARLLGGQRLTEMVLPKLKDLKMPHARMTWEMPPCAPDDIGMETPEVWLSTNPGSPLLPLTKVASGGERSRFMLALKSVLAGIQSTPVIVLDEIDTGVSGEVAMHMGRAMKEMAQSSKTQQVLSVTHLPQVAAQAEHHWEVQKITDGASTHVQVVELKKQARCQAIATMLSGDNVTSEALGQAKKLMASTGSERPIQSH